MTIPRLLIVDDDQDFARSLGILFELEGCQVDLAFSGEEVQRKFQDSDFDLIFLDIHLPGMSGVECFREFRRIKPDAKVIMMTAYGVQKELAQLRDESDFGVLRKPLNVEELVTVLRVLDCCVLPISGEDPDLVERLVRLLDAKGYRALVAHDSGEAEQKAQLRCRCLDPRHEASGLEWTRSLQTDRKAWRENPNHHRVRLVHRRGHFRRAAGHVDRGILRQTLGAERAAAKHKDAGGGLPEGTS